MADLRVAEPSRTRGGAGGSVPGARLMVGRRPILNRRRELFGYELRFCPTADVPSVAPDSAAVPKGAAIPSMDDASARLLAEHVMSAGLDRLAHGHRAFIELPAALLAHDDIRLLPAAGVVLQVPCDGLVDANALDACRRLKRDGYAIAATHVDDASHAADLLSLADFVKVDFPRSDSRELRERLTARGGPPPPMIAVNVDAIDTFNDAVRDGFGHVQGFFFEQRGTLRARALPRGQIGCLHLLYALSDPHLSLGGLEDLVKRDAALCYRLLSTVNSAGFAQSRKITSIRDALLLVGRDTIRRWASLWVMNDLGGEAHAELTAMASVRGRFCEVLIGGTKAAEAAGEAFLLGLCSCLDVILECPMTAILAELPLSPEVTAALLGGANFWRRLLDCVIAYERGDWAACVPGAEACGVFTRHARRRAPRRTRLGASDASPGPAVSLARPERAAPPALHFPTAGFERSALLFRPWRSERRQNGSS